MYSSKILLGIFIKILKVVVLKFRKKGHNNTNIKKRLILDKNCNNVLENSNCNKNKNAKITQCRILKMSILVFSHAVSGYTQNVHKTRIANTISVVNFNFKINCIIYF